MKTDNPNIEFKEEMFNKMKEEFKEFSKIDNSEIIFVGKYKDYNCTVTLFKEFNEKVITLNREKEIELEEKDFLELISYFKLGNCFSYMVKHQNMFICYIEEIQNEK